MSECELTNEGKPEMEHFLSLIDHVIERLRIEYFCQQKECESECLCVPEVSDVDPSEISETRGDSDKLSLCEQADLWGRYMDAITQAGVDIPNVLLCGLCDKMVRNHVNQQKSSSFIPSADSSRLTETRTGVESELTDSTEQIKMSCSVAARNLLSVCDNVKERGTAPSWVDVSSVRRRSAFVAQCRNGRRRMEDRAAVRELIDPGLSESGSVYSVCDGHRGVEAAEFVAVQFPFRVRSVPNGTQENVREFLKEICYDMDLSFIEKACREELRSGSTLVSVYIRGSRLYTVWLGDSQAWLYRGGGVPVRLMRPHTPESERSRIESLGGVVVWFGAWRVNGTLGVSRSVGDAEHKPYVSGEAEVSCVELDGSEEFVVLGTDGLWDGVAPRDVPGIVGQCTGQSAVDALVQRAKEGESRDNITAMVVYFK